MKPFGTKAGLVFGILLLAACSPASRPTDSAPSVQELAATIAAATIQAAQAGTPTASASPIPLATPTVKPTLFINGNSISCRSGPGPDFGVIATYSAGTSVDLMGRNSAANYWVVQDPSSHDLCWIQVQDATPGGSFEGVPEMTAQPVAVALPAKPNSVGRPDFACDNSSLTTILRWYAPPGPVNGYRVYREGNQIAELSADQTTYTEKVPFVYGSTVEYAVAAYNDAGMSPQRTWNVHCP